MSLKNTYHTKHWDKIPKKCRNCIKAIYTIENNEVLYQCSIWGKFKKTCELQTSSNQTLRSEEDILNKE